MRKVMWSSLLALYSFRMTRYNSTRTVGSVSISHPEKMIFSAQGINKGDVAEYYFTVRDLIIPYLRERALSCIRCPAGCDKGCFMQKHPGSWLTTSVPRITLPELEGEGSYLFVRNISDLLALVQSNAIELHTWTAQLSDIEHPDQMIFDLDPDETIPPPLVNRIALALRELLLTFNLQSFPRVTGGKGIHLVIPLERIHSWREVHTCAYSIATKLVELFPDDLTVNPLKHRRRGKIFVDYLRNSRGATTIVNYSLRARPGATVAMPLDWSSVTPKLQMNGFTLTSVKHLIATGLSDPWSGFHKLQQRLPPLETPPYSESTLPAHRVYTPRGHAPRD